VIIKICILLVENYEDDFELVRFLLVQASIEVLPSRHGKHVGQELAR
jgi:hypothetical protein